MVDVRMVMGIRPETGGGWNIAPVTGYLRTGHTDDGI